MDLMSESNTRSMWAVAAALYGGALPWVTWEDDEPIPLDVVILR
jgi:hypothetical protein